ncbi:hypothetical protein ILUMI_08454 [Ignelater luminosus]|uniref:DDE Tnp4 domain-containing protein n=1 Tax=Ignelater luminosus TaxID=2038154 RepID=A0A8K0D687_IGNLU|nr:hypothetical protein ILUMI_08454 [Ignelater luminosus]
MNLLSSACNNDGSTELHEYEATPSDTDSGKEELEENGNSSGNTSEEEILWLREHHQCTITAERQGREGMLSLLSNPKLTCTKFIKNGVKNLITHRWTEEPFNEFWQSGYQFFKYTRLYVNEYKELVALIDGKLNKRSCLNTITTEERLAITLHYIAQGGAMCEIARSPLRGRASVSRIIRETCNVLWETLSPIYLSPPSLEEWEHIKTQFYEKWTMLNLIRAIDGKHIPIQNPFKSCTRFYNYKHFYSIHLMAICDADYKFIFVDIGATITKYEG